MSKEKFTPGPWHAHEGIMEPDYVYFGEEEGCDEEGRVICEVYTRPKGHFVCPDVALIAAAPEMYEALYDATNNYCGVCRQEPIDIIKDGCPKERYKSRAYVTSCVAQKWLKILRKARGEA